MKSRSAIVSIAACAAIIAATMAALFYARGPRAPGPGEAEAGPAGDAGAAAAESPAIGPTIADKPGPGPIRLPGQVFDAAGNPIAGVEISAELERMSGEEAKRSGAEQAPENLGENLGENPTGGYVTTPEVVATSGPDGRFVLVGLAAGRYRLRVAGAEIFPSEIRFFDVAEPGEPDAGADAAGVRLIVARKVSVRGAVVDGRGAPAAGVSVSVSGDSLGRTQSAITGERGEFAFDGLQEGVFQIWAARGDLGARARRIARLGPGPFEDVVLTLLPAAIVTGRVVERGTGRGLMAAVSLTATSLDEPTRHRRSESDGSFRIEGVPPGRWSAAAYAPGYVAIEAIDFEVGRGYEPVIELGRGAVIAGRAVDGSGVAVADAIVSVRGTDESGRVAEMSQASLVRRLRRATGRTRLPAQARPGLEGEGSGNFIPRGELGVLLGPIPYPPPRGAAALRIARALQGNTGKGGAQNRDVLSGLIAGSSTDIEPRFVTDSGGRFRLTGLDAGRYRVVATHPDYADGASKPISLRRGQRASNVVITLVPGVVLVGEVKNTRGEIVVGATVIAEFAGGKRSGALAAPRLQAVTGIDGRYQLGPIAQSVELRVTAVRHGDVERSFDIARLRKSGTLSGTRIEKVVDFVLPVADAKLFGRVLDGVDFPVRDAVVAIDTRDRGARGRQATTDQYGHFAIDALPPATYDLAIRHRDFPAARARGKTGEQLAITLAFGGGIAGEVRDAHTGSAIAGARIAARGPKKQTAETAAGEGGAFELAAMVPGRWTVTASAPGYVARAKTVAVKAGLQPGQITVRDLGLTLSRGATIGGTVRDPYGARVRGATVRVGQRSAQSDENGRFRMRDVATGTVVITAEREGARGSVSITLAPGDEFVTLEIALGKPEIKPETKPAIKPAIKPELKIEPE